MIIHGNSLDKLRELEENSIDAVVTDPPYGLKFMGKKWDYDVPSVEIWKEVLRVLKPGGHLLSFGGTRTYHRMVVSIEDAGFEIRDQIQWLYGSGFPKSHDISKAINKQAGAERKIIGKKSTFREPQAPNGWDCTKRAEFETALNTPDAVKWQGWGTALKPANEPICVARKPLEKGLTIAENVLKYGTGGINIDACRISTKDIIPTTNNQNIKGNSFKSDNSEKDRDTVYIASELGRFPANLILDEVAAEMLDKQHSTTAIGYRKNSSTNKTTWFGTKDGSHIEGERGYKDTGGASRFFYVAKASKSERNKGLGGMLTRSTHRNGAGIGEGKDPAAPSKDQNFHPTIKPVKLMEYLIKLITPKDGTVLDPFMGSGSTGVACKKLGFNFIGVELNKEYVEIAEKRINYSSQTA